MVVTCPKWIGDFLSFFPENFAKRLPNIFRPKLTVVLDMLSSISFHETDEKVAQSISSSDFDHVEMDLATADKIILETEKKSYLMKSKSQRQKIFDLFEDPTSSKAAYYIQLYIMVVIIIATINFCLESIPNLSDKEWKQNVWFSIETFCIINFLIEYICRILTTPSICPWVYKFLNLVDLLAILPYFFDIFLRLFVDEDDLDGVSNLAIVRVIRLVRVFRMFKMAKSSERMQLFARALHRSLDGIFILIILVLSATVLFSSMVFFAEGTWCELQEGVWYYTEGPNLGQECNFQSIVHAFWWCIVTMTTVGYGDVVPLSYVGKLVGSFTVLSGLIVLALPVTVIGTHFSDVYDEYRKEQNRRIQYARVLFKSKQTAQEDKNITLKEQYDKISIAIEEGERKIATLNTTVQDLRYRQNLLITNILKNNQILNTDKSETPKESEKSV